MSGSLAGPVPGTGGAPELTPRGAWSAAILPDIDVSAQPTAANTAFSAQKIVQNPGWIVAVTPRTGNQTIPHGRYYAVAALVDQSGAPVRVLWAGYFCSELNGLPNAASGPGGVSSVPNAFAQDGWSVAIFITGGSNATTTDVIQFKFAISATEPVGAGWIFAEAPGSGAGEILNLTTANPAAGADPSAITVPNYVHQVLRSYSGKQVSSTGGTARYPIITHTPNGQNAVVIAIALTSQGASVTVQYTFEKAVTSVATTDGQAILALPDKILKPGDTYQLTCNPIQASDQWSLLERQLEEWAFPAP